MQVDEKDRPTVPIIITNCGELELKKHKDTGKSPSKCTSEMQFAPVTVLIECSLDNPKPKKHRSRRRSHSNSSDGEGHPRRKKNKQEEADHEVEEASRGDVTRKETEEEYDVRLEREETERLEKERKRVLDHIKATYSKGSGSGKDGVRYKGMLNSQAQFFISISHFRSRSDEVR